MEDFCFTDFSSSERAEKIKGTKDEKQGPMDELRGFFYRLDGLQILLEKSYTKRPWEKGTDDNAVLSITQSFVYKEM